MTMVTTKSVNSSGKVYRARVIIVGEPTVGKSSLVENICTDGTSFLKNYTPTSCIDLRQKMFNLPSTTENVELLLLDSAGMDVYESINKKTWPEGSLFCLVYDVTKKTTLDKVAKWMDMVQPYSIRNTQGILLANKIDLSNRRIVSESYGRDLAHKHGLSYYECSAKENVGVHDVFMGVAQDVYRRMRN